MKIKYRTNIDTGKYKEPFETCDMNGKRVKIARALNIQKKIVIKMYKFNLFAADME